MLKRGYHSTEVDPGLYSTQVEQITELFKLLQINGCICIVIANAIVSLNDVVCIVSVACSH